jgi:hypothetical protein
MINCKYFRRKRLWPNFKVRLLHEGNEKNHENSQSGRELSLGPPEYKAVVLINRPRRSIGRMDMGTIPLFDYQIFD